MTFSSPTYTATGSTVDDSVAYPVDSVTFSIANRNGATLWTRVSSTGLAVYDGELTFTSGAGGRLGVAFWRPGQLGAGTYDSTVKIEICLDDACATHLAGSPFSVNVTYVVTGSAGPTTKIQWSDNNAGLFVKEFETKQTSSPVAELRFNISNVPAQGLWVARRKSTNGILGNLLIQSVNQGVASGSVGGVFHVPLTPPAALGSGVFADTMDIMACFDELCERIVPDSAFTMQTLFIVLASEGTEYHRRALTFPAGATDLAWSPAHESLYVLSGLSQPPLPVHSILQVDPLNGTYVERATLGTGESLGRIALADDGSMLYASSGDTPAIRRFQLPSMTEDAPLPLGLPEAHMRVSDLVVVPGAPHTYVATMTAFSEDKGVYAYDAGSARPQSIAAPAMGWERERFLAQGEAADTFYSLRHLPLPPFTGTVEKLTLDANGLTVTDGFALDGDIRQVHYGDGRLFATDGSVMDPVTGAPLGKLPMPLDWPVAALVVDPLHHRVFVRALGDYLLSFDTRTLEPIAMMRFDISTQKPTFPFERMTLWGTDGVALVDGTNLVILSGTFFTTYDGRPTMPMPTDPTLY